MNSPVPSTAAASIIVVIGMHRSGTSMCSNILHALGADMADEVHAAPANAKGHWERPRLVDTNDAIFGFFRRPWGSPSHVLDMPEHWLGDPRVREMHVRACNWLRPLMGAQRPFGFKDPRTTLLLRFWTQVFSEIGARPNYVFCVREPAQVARSLQSRDSMERGQAEYRWLSYNIEAIRSMVGRSICIVPYEEWFRNPQDLAVRLAKHVDLPAPSPETVRQIIDVELRHDDARIVPAAALSQRLHKLIIKHAAKTFIPAELQDLVVLLTEMKHQVQPLLIDAEVTRVGSTEQHRVIMDLQALVGQLRVEDKPAVG